MTKPGIVLVALVLSLVGGPSASAAPPVDGTHFVDPTARLVHPARMRFGDHVYVAPFATLRAGTDRDHRIRIGDRSDIQDSALVDATDGTVTTGPDVIVAHGAAVLGPASIGLQGTCPAEGACATFISFNAEVDGAVIETDAMVSALSRVGPDVTLPSGLKTIPGRNIESQAEVATETTPVTDADRDFMAAVLHVNETFAMNYAVLADENDADARGINYDPGGSDFNPERDLPALAGVVTRAPGFRNRIVGDVTLSDSKRVLDRRTGRNISIRADEGEPFAVGTVSCMGNRTTFHALEHTMLQLGDHGCYAYRSIVHGGPTDQNDTTITGNGFTLGAHSVFYRSVAGDDVTIGYRSLVQQTELPDGAVVPARTIMIAGEVLGAVEW